jgi:N-acetylglucosamine kinase-like BadF-type ATPase
MPDEGPLVMGIDGGGSKTLALLADENGQVIGRGLAGLSNFQVEGILAARKALQDAVQEAFHSAGVAVQKLAALCLGMAGISRPADRQWLDAWLAEEQAAEKIEIVTDGAVLLWAGTPDGWGIGVVSGTGSIAMGSSPDGKWARSGGWGPLLGDEGSAYAMGLAALHAITQAADGRGPVTRLTGLVLETWNLPDSASLVGYVYQNGKSHPRIAGLGPVVSRAAAQGDEAALKIQAQTSADLAKMAVAVVRQLGLTNAVPCALGGGVLIHNEAIVRGLIEAACLEKIVLEPVEMVNEPARGAVRLALRAVPR